MGHHANVLVLQMSGWDADTWSHSPVTSLLLAVTTVCWPVGPRGCVSSGKGVGTGSSLAAGDGHLSLRDQCGPQLRVAKQEGGCGTKTEVASGPACALALLLVL